MKQTHTRARRGPVRGATPAICLVLLTACTSPPPAEAVDLPIEAAPREDALAGYQHQPEAAPPPVNPNTQPRLKFRAMFEPGVDDEYSGMFCNYDVEALGFPAIDERGESIVSIDSRSSSGGEGEDEITYVEYHAAGEAPRSEVVFNRGLDELDYSGEADANMSKCAPRVAEVRARIDELNAQLAQRRWRALEPLDVIGEPEFAYYESERYDVTALPLAQRPVEMLYNSGKFILRVRASKVLLSLDKREWSMDDEPSWMCSRKPKMRTLEVDRRSGLALVTYDYITGGCLCDDYSYQAALELPEAVFAEVDARPTSAAVLQ